MAITFLKYLPQLVSNFRRQSTLVLDCGPRRDWSGIVGDVAKFALGSISIVFDLLFMVQHCVLYPPKRAGPRTPLLGVQ
ncbi:L-cystine transmembrane transporter [Aureococcus anophagefferens]|uniref:L-cystine transmembrane transporter n=1 Tax=Aureococcus anophagefferens TaxID=44056 RepID=A0ABR1G820_AURAN